MSNTTGLTGCCMNLCISHCSYFLFDFSIACICTVFTVWWYLISFGKAKSISKGRANGIILRQILFCNRPPPAVIHHVSTNVLVHIVVVWILYCFPLYPMTSLFLLHQRTARTLFEWWVNCEISMIYSSGIFFYLTEIMIKKKRDACYLLSVSFWSVS